MCLGAVRPAGDAEGEPQVGGRAGERPGRRREVPAGLRGRAGWLEPAQRHGSGGRLEAVDAAVGRRDPDRARQVGAVLQIGQSRGDRGRGAPGRATRRARRVAGLSVRPYTGFTVRPKSASMRCTLDLPTTIAPAARSRSTTAASWSATCSANSRLTPGRVHAFDGEGVLDGHRNAVQWPEIGTARDGPVRVLGGSERGVTVGFDDGVELGILDAVEEFFGQVTSRERAAADPGGGFGGGPEGHGRGVRPDTVSGSSAVPGCASWVTKSHSPTDPRTAEGDRCRSQRSA